MATFETTTQNTRTGSNYDRVAQSEEVAVNKHMGSTSKKIIIVVAALGWTLFIIFMILYALEIKNNKSSNSNCSNAQEYNTTTTPSTSPSMIPSTTPRSTPSITPSTSPFASSIPKNLIIIISDGMGQSYNTAYRTFKGLNRTVMDRYFKGRYSTKSTNIDGITDSAAGATVFACGVPSQNDFIGLDGNANPFGSILAAAKRQFKGTGLIATKSITDATPASFSAHTMYRSFNKFISKQQAMRQINGKPMLDLLLGGGRKWFESWDFFNNITLQEEYGWNKVSKNGTDFLQDVDNPNINDLPYMGLFADDGYPYYVDRMNGYIKLLDEGVGEYPGLLSMTKKGINLLNTKYSTQGFFLMVEASEVDLCGHDNDIVCLLWEMEEFMTTSEYVMDWAANDGETLVVILSDHETGGMSIGRDNSYITHDLVNYLQGQTAKNDDVAAAFGSFLYDYNIAAPSYISGNISNVPVYKWYPYAVAGAKHTASWFADQLNLGSNGSTISNLTQLYDWLESSYLGDVVGNVEPILTEKEKEFIADVYNRDYYARIYGVAQLMNVRTLTGWSTHGHSGSDVAVHAFGPNEDLFSGHWISYEIGRILTEAFGVETEQMMETEYIQQLYMNGSLPICDATDKPIPSKLYVEWNNSIEYPSGNLLYGTGVKCIESW